MWARTAALRRATLDHPFNRALQDGSLDGDRFGYYLTQDAHYLISFARALASAAVRADDVAAAAFFAHSARVALLDERQLHAGYLQDLGIAAADRAVPTPTGLAYGSFLVATAATDPYPVLVAALVPCFAVYHEVGTAIAAAVDATLDHPYRAWIDTYSDDAFAASVEVIWGIVDRLAAAADARTRTAMAGAFVRACEYEWMFWDGAWRMEAWPTAGWVPPPTEAADP